MNTKKLILSISIGVIASAVLISAVQPAFAYQGDPTKTGPNYSPERHDAITKAFAQNDYEAWKNLTQNRGRVGEVITKENFAQFTKMHTLMLEGKTAEAQTIRQSLGLGTGIGKRNGMGRQAQ